MNKPFPDFSKSLIQSHWKVFTLFFLLSLTAYSSNLTGSFKTLDDFYSIVASDLIKNFSNIGTIFQSSFFGRGDYYRPLVYVSFMLEYHLFKLNPILYNLDNLILHAASALGVFLIALRLTREPRISLLAGLLFAVHPIQWEAVANVSGRSILLCTFFLLHAFRFYVFSMEEEWKARRHYLCSVSFFILSLLSKESSLIFPALLLSYLFFFKDRVKWSSSRRLLSIVPFCAVIAFYLFLRRKFGIMIVFSTMTQRDILLGTATFLKELIHSIQLFVFPLEFYYDRSAVMFKNFQDPWLWVSLLFWAAFLAVVLIKRRKIPREVFFFLFWTVISLITVSQIVPIKLSWDRILTADHFFYLPSAGIFILMAFLFKRFFLSLSIQRVLSPRLRDFCLGGFMVYLFLMTVVQSMYASQQIALFQRALKHNPDNNRVRNSLAVIYGLGGRSEDAEKEFRRSLDSDSCDVRARIGLGRALYDQGKYWESLQEYEKIGDPQGLEDVLKENMKLSQDKVVEKYRKRLEEEPDNAQLQYSLGVMYSKMEKTEESIVHYQRAVELNPLYKNALFNLASSLEAKERPQEAVPFYERLIGLEEEKDELDQMAYLRLAEIYQKAGLMQNAQVYLKEAEKIKNRK